MSLTRRTALVLLAGLVLFGLGGVPAWLHLSSQHGTADGDPGGARGCCHCPSSPADDGNENGENPPSDKPKPHDSSRCDICQALGALKTNDPICAVVLTGRTWAVTDLPDVGEGLLAPAPARRQPPCRAPPRPFRHL